jgi:hypothetical protein
MGEGMLYHIRHPNWVPFISHHSVKIYHRSWEPRLLQRPIGDGMAGLRQTNISIPKQMGYHDNILTTLCMGLVDKLEIFWSTSIMHLVNNLKIF